MRRHSSHANANVVNNSKCRTIGNRAPCTPMLRNEKELEHVVYSRDRKIVHHANIVRWNTFSAYGIDRNRIVAIKGWSPTLNHQRETLVAAWLTFITKQKHSKYKHIGLVLELYRMSRMSPCIHQSSQCDIENTRTCQEPQALFEVTNLVHHHVQIHRNRLLQWSRHTNFEK